MFNLLHNLQGLGPSPPTLGANNMIVDSRVINPTFPPTKRANKENYYHKHTKGPANNGVGHPLGGQVVKPLDLTR
jgi:hypothetical protein